MSAAGIKIRQFSPFYAALDAEMSRVREQLIGNDSQEHERVENALIRLRGGKKLGIRLSYQEYVEALQPYTKALGKFEMILPGAVRSKRNFVAVLVIDPKKIAGYGLKDADISDHTEKSPKNKTDGLPPNKPQNHMRPCPKCGKKIPVKAIFCTHCKTKVASHIKCQHCGKETPDDLAICWACGRDPQKQEKRIECKMCCSFTGTIDQFPCPVCGWIPENVEADQPQSESTRQDKTTTEENNGTSDESPNLNEDEPAPSTDDDADENPEQNTADFSDSDHTETENIWADDSEDMIECQFCSAKNPKNAKECFNCGSEKWNS